jgi:protein SCO1/2
MPNWPHAASESAPAPKPVAVVAPAPAPVAAPAPAPVAAPAPRLAEKVTIALEVKFDTSKSIVKPEYDDQLKKVSEILGDKMGKSIFCYSISVDPKNDTPAALTEFKKKYQIGKGWTFLTGSVDDITLIQKKFGLEPAGDTPTEHSTTILLANEATGQWIKRSPYENPQMLANLLAGHLNAKGMLMSEVGPKQSYAKAVSVPNGGDGEQLYRTRCASCHTIGGGDGLGPDLMMATGKHTDAWMKRWLREPDKMIAEGDAYATAQMKQFRNLAMPNLKLDDHAIDLLIAFMDKESVTVMEGKQAAQHAHHH